MVSTWILTYLPRRRTRLQDKRLFRSMKAIERVYQVRHRFTSQLHHRGDTDGQGKGDIDAESVGTYTDDKPFTKRDMSTLNINGMPSICSYQVLVVYLSSRRARRRPIRRLQ